MRRDSTGDSVRSRIDFDDEPRLPGREISVLSVRRYRRAVDTGELTRRNLRNMFASHKVDEAECVVVLVRDKKNGPCFGFALSTHSVQCKQTDNQRWS